MEKIVSLENEKKHWNLGKRKKMDEKLEGKSLRIKWNVGTNNKIGKNDEKTS